VPHQVNVHTSAPSHQRRKRERFSQACIGSQHQSLAKTLAMQKYGFQNFLNGIECLIKI
jgi:hypothetical protein